MSKKSRTQKNHKGTRDYRVHLMLSIPAIDCLMDLIDMQIVSISAAIAIKAAPDDDCVRLLEWQQDLWSLIQTVTRQREVQAYLDS